MAKKPKKRGILDRIWPNRGKGKKHPLPKTVPQLANPEPVPVEPVDSVPSTVSGPSLIRVIDDDNPENWSPSDFQGGNMPAQKEGSERDMMTGPIDAEREAELDDVEEDELDELIDEEEEPEPELEPEPLKVRKKVKKTKELQYLSREDLKVLILEKYDEGWKTYEIHNWLKKECLADANDEDFLTIHQIGGFKSLAYVKEDRKVTVRDIQQRQQAQPIATRPVVENPSVTQPMPQPVPPQPVVPQPVAPSPPVQPTKRDITIPRPTTKLETFVQMLDRAMETGNKGLAQIAVDGIYKEMDREEGGGVNDKVWELLTAQLAAGKGKSKLSELKELTSLVKDLMPEGPQAESESVAMARVVSETATRITTEAKDTILEVTGSKGKADDMGKCPNCDKIIPKDSLWCSYCGLAFQTTPSLKGEAEEEEEDEYEVEQKVRSTREKKKREDVTDTVMQKPQSTPKPTAPTKQEPEVIIAPHERATILRHLKRLANFISQKDDPLIKTRALFKAGDDEDRRAGLLLAVIGRERLINAAKRLTSEHPELQEFDHYVGLCDSADGKEWIDVAFGEVKNQSRLMGVILKREEAAVMLNEIEKKLGFKIE